MCYMVKRSTTSKRKRVATPLVRAVHQAERTVGVRELRQNLSVYLERVKAGEALTVTEHGEEVALLRPLPKDLSPLQRAVAEGRATPPTRSLRDLRVPTVKASRPTIEILDELREDRF